jgi:hypothetical protein
MVRRRIEDDLVNRALRAGGRGYGGGGGVPLARPLHPAGHGPPEFQLQFTAVQEGFTRDRPRTLVQVEPIWTTAIRAANAVVVRTTG